MAKKSKREQVDELIAKGYRFIGLYENNVFVTHMGGNNIVEAIKDFDEHYNSMLTTIFDVKEHKIYIGRENDEVDARGCYNYSYYDKETNELVYNQDEATQPVVKVKASKITKDLEHGYINRQGKFYACGFEAHRWLAKELFLTKTIEKPEAMKNRDNEDCLDNMGWVRVSSTRIHFLYETKLTVEQKATIIKFMDIIGEDQYEFMYHLTPKAEIEKMLEEEY